MWVFLVWFDLMAALLAWRGRGSVGSVGVGGRDGGTEGGRDGRVRSRKGEGGGWLLGWLVGR